MQQRPKVTTLTSELSKVAILPPPNITGNLHLGHILNICVQDMYIRYQQLANQDKIIWIPGSDHASIGTQMLVQKHLHKNGLNNYSKDYLLEAIKEWKSKHENLIKTQLYDLNTTLDWSNYTFTLDKIVQDAVVFAFSELYKANLIYKAMRMVNWDTKLNTALSDIEVIKKDIKSTMYHIRYSNNDINITIATTRPETLFGDVAIAVHPNDVRYQHLIGRIVKIPIINRDIPIIADKDCDMQKGTGAVKITPAHDYLDYEIGKRHNLPIVSVIDKSGLMTVDPVKNMTVQEARQHTVNLLQEGGYITRVEKVISQIPHGERSGSVIEPILTEEWFLDMPALKHYGCIDKIHLIPDFFHKTYSHWLDTLEPWCLSRTLVWGHQIPVYYTADYKKEFVGSVQEVTQEASKYGYSYNDLIKESRVFDTWFSSALWPLVTIGWPYNFQSDKYPNEFLVTGFDILGFWVLKMITLCTYFTKKIPFKQIFLHGMVLDSNGQKMSKSKNNAIDPNTIIMREQDRELGLSILKFTLLSSVVPGKNLKLSQQRLQYAKHFINKISNFVKYIKQSISNASNIGIFTIEYTPIHEINRWIVNELNIMMRNVQSHINAWHIQRACHAISHFIWDIFCSWYIELSKGLLGINRKDTEKTLLYCAQNILQISSTFMPEIANKYWSLICPIALPQILIKTHKIQKSDNFSNVINMQKIIAGLRSISQIFDIQGEIAIDSKLPYQTFIQLLTKRTLVVTTAISYDVAYPMNNLWVRFNVRNSHSLKEIFEKHISQINKKIEQLTRKIDMLTKCANDKQVILQDAYEELSCTKKHYSELTRSFANYCEKGQGHL